MVRLDTDAALAADLTKAVSDAEARELRASPIQLPAPGVVPTETMVDYDSAGEVVALALLGHFGGVLVVTAPPIAEFWESRPWW
jgi:hypothetical protein